RGQFIKDKLGYVLRYDGTNPDNKINNDLYSKYSSSSAGYSEPSTKQSFILAALDWAPAKNVHIMPNIWYLHYKTQISGLTGKVNGDDDLVYRITLFYTFGK